MLVEYILPKERLDPIVSFSHWFGSEDFLPDRPKHRHGQMDSGPGQKPAGTRAQKKPLDL